MHAGTGCSIHHLYMALLSMKSLSRRSFLTASAMMAAGPAIGAPRRAAPPAPQSDSIEVVIVGAGAAGIAAARRLAAAGRRFVVVEAASQIGGRCITDTRTFGVPYDRGAHWIYRADVNPVARFAAQTGLDIYPAPRGQRVRIGRRYAREGEMEDFLAALVQTNAAIADAARKGDVACSQVLPKDLGEWRSSIEFVLGPYGCGKDLAEVSTADLSRAAERDSGAFCRQGLGTLIARLGAGTPVQVATPATRIEWWSRSSVKVETTAGQIQARAAIVTVSTNVLAAGKINFQPDLPKRHIEAANRLELGSYDRIALELPENPLGLRADELVFEKSDSKQTAAVFANVSGSTLCTIDVAGSFGRDLSAKGEAAMCDFAVSWLGELYGTDMKNAVKRRHATRWNNEPWVLGAASVAVPGAQPARRVMMEPLNNRIFFAGEAAHETMWGTIGGAWESGERAADAVIRTLGAKRG
jgi:monoamine oxidase